MTKRIRTRTIDITAHDWRVEVATVANAMKKHANRLETLKMASYEVYLVFSHCFGLDGHENYGGSQDRICDHLEKHRLRATGNQVHDCKHTGICWLTNARRRRRSNRVGRIFDGVIDSWESRVGREPGAGIRFLEKHQRFRQILSDVLEQKSDFLDKLSRYERVYRQKSNQKLFLPKIIQEFAQGKEISQIVFELKNSGIKIAEKDVDLSLEVAVIFSEEKINNGDVSDQAREIVEAIKERRLSNQGGEPMNNLDFIRGQLKEAVNADMSILDTFAKKVETWKEKGGEDLFLIETINKFLAGDDDNVIEFDLNLPKDEPGGTGIERLELVLRLLGGEWQLLDQPSEWVVAKLIAIEEAYKVQAQASGGAKMEQAEITPVVPGESDIVVLQEKSVDCDKPVKRIPMYYHKLWLYIFGGALEKGTDSGDMEANRAVWVGPYLRAVKEWTIAHYSYTAKSKDRSFSDRWQALRNQQVIIPALSYKGETGTRTYYVLDPNQFNIVDTPDTKALTRWLGPEIVKVAEVVVEQTPLIKVAATPRGIKPVASKVEEVKVVSLKDALIVEDQQRIQSLSQEIANLDSVIQKTKDELVAMEADKTLLSGILESRKEEMKRLGVDGS